MTNAERDENRVPWVLGISSTDPSVTLPLQINPVTRRVIIEATGWSVDNMTKTVYDPSNMSKDLFSVSNLVYTDANNGSNTTGNGSIKAPYATIQFAIDSITTQTSDNRYQVIAYPGLYEENITMKGYVDLSWPWVIVRGTSWVLITLTDNVSIIERIRFELLPTTSGHSIVSCTTASGRHEMNFCEFDVTSSTNGITASMGAISAGTILITDSLQNYTMTGTSATQNTHKIFDITGSAWFSFFRNTTVSAISDENDIIYPIYDDSTWITIVSQIINILVVTNVSYSWQAFLYYFNKTASDKFIYQNLNQIFGSGSGTGHIYGIDSDTDDLIVASQFNRNEVSWFANNYFSSIWTWDTLRSFFDNTNNWTSVGLWTLEKVHSQNGEIRVNTAIVDETLLLGAPTNESLEQLFNISFSAGYVSGGLLTEPGSPDGTMTVWAGTGLIRIADSNTAQIKSFDWDETVLSTLVDWSNNIVYIDYNSGTPIVTSSTNRAIILDNEYDKFELAEVVREGTVLHISDHRQKAADVWHEVQTRMYSIKPVERADNTGLILWETGTRNVTVTAWNIWRKLIKEPVSAKDTSAASTFDSYYTPDSGATWTKISADTQWDDTQYNDITSGLVTMTNNRYSYQDFYLNWEGNLVRLYGQAEYTSLAAAEEAPASSSVPIRIEFNSILIGRIVFQKSDTVAQNVLSAFTTTLSAATTSDHGNLSGLSDDDHTQYSLISSQAGVPSSTPTRVGEVNIDTTNDIAYISTGTASSADWTNTSAWGSPLTTKGDVYTYDTDDQRLAVGTNWQILTADSAEATWLKWIDSAWGGSNFQSHKSTTASTKAYLSWLGVETLANISVNAAWMTGGRVNVVVDWVDERTLFVGQELSTIVSPSTSLSVVTADNPYDISTGTFTQIALSVSAQDVSPSCLLYNDDGTVLYVLSENWDDINEYALSTAYDISTGTFTQIALSLLAQENQPRSIIFNDDWTVLYVLWDAVNDINEYALSTAYDISTGTFTQIALSINSQETSPRDFMFNDDWTKLYVIWQAGREVNEWALSTAYDISTWTFTQIALSVNSEESTPVSMVYNDTWMKLYILWQQRDDITEWNLSTAYDISTWIYSRIVLSVTSEDTLPIDIIFNNDWTTLYMLWDTGNDKNEYGLNATYAGTVLSSINNV